MPEIGRDLWKLPGPTPPSLLNQGHPELVVQDHVQVVSEYLQRWRFHHLSGKPVLVFGHLQIKEELSDVQMEPGAH